MLELLCFILITLQYLLLAAGQILLCQWLLMYFLDLPRNQSLTLSVAGNGMTWLGMGLYRFYLNRKVRRSQHSNPQE